MSDIATLWNTTRGDWSLAGDALAGGNDIVTAVLISLFTDRVANRDDVIPDSTRRSKDPRGWWADAARYPIGSRLWLIERAKKTQQTLSLAQGYIVEALQWLVDDGVASRIEVKVEWTRVNTLGAQIVVYSPRTGAPIVKLGAQNVFRLPDAQAWGWNTEQGTGQWVELETRPVVPPPPPPPPPDLPWILLSNFESPNTGTTVTDESVTGNTPTTYSDTHDEPGTAVTAVRAKFGTQSWGVVYNRATSFSNRTLLYPSVPAYALPGAFTLAYWVWPDGTFSSSYPDVYCAASILDFSANPHVQWGTRLLNSHLSAYIDNVEHGGGGGTNTVPPGQWNLIEVSRQINLDGSATLRTFVNGVKTLEEACSSAALAAQQITVSGFVKNGLLPNVYAGGGSDPKCYDSIGLLKGLVLHTNSYTPPTVPYARTMTLAQTGV